MIASEQFDKPVRNQNSYGSSKAESILEILKEAIQLRGS